MHDRDGNSLALSWLPARTHSNIAHFEAFRVARERADAGVWLGEPVRSPTDGEWMIPVGRRLETPDGAFAGTVGARLRIDYFTDFYRDIKLEAGTKVTLMHHGGALLARFPLRPEAVGQRFEPSSRAALAASRADGAAPVRVPSPVDGVDRYVAMAGRAGYPVDVIVSRDADAVLGAWSAQAAAPRCARWPWPRSPRCCWPSSRAVPPARRRARPLRPRGGGLGRRHLGLGLRQEHGLRLAARTRVDGPGAGPRSADDGRVVRRAAPAPRGRAAAPGRTRRASAGPRAAYEGDYRVMHGQGDAAQYRWVRVRGLCVRDAEGRPLRLAGSIADIDALKRAEASLRESESRYELAVAGSDDGIWEWDFVREQAFESARARELQGLPPGPELQPLPDLLASLRVHPEDATRRAQAIQAHLLGTTPAYECEYRVRHDDGAYRWIRVRALCVCDAAGQPQRMAGSVTDIDAQNAPKMHCACRRNATRWR